jgi:hypothetical protein
MESHIVRLAKYYLAGIPPCQGRNLMSWEQEGLDMVLNIVEIERKREEELRKARRSVKH